MDYHPDFFAGAGSSCRANCEERLAVLRRHVRGSSLLDIGCSGGYYSFGMRERLPDVVAIDEVPELVEGCLRVQEREGTDIDFRCVGLVEFLDSAVRRWDNVFYLSVHHHIVEQEGNAKAAELLRRVSEVGDRLFFDMGQQNEKRCQGHSWWRMLPSLGDASQEDWLREYLLTNTVFTSATVVGSSPIHGVRRMLWKLERG